MKYRFHAMRCTARRFRIDDIGNDQLYPGGSLPGRPEEQSSSTRTSAPSATSRATRWDPIKPTPPVTRSRALKFADPARTRNRRSVDSASLYCSPHLHQLRSFPAQFVADVRGSATAMSTVYRGRVAGLDQVGELSLCSPNRHDRLRIRRNSFGSRSSIGVYGGNL
jgi:hypothetical protein